MQALVHSSMVRWALTAHHRAAPYPWGLDEHVRCQKSMSTIPNEAEISARATMIARGLLATKRAVGIISMDDGRLRLKCRSGGYYWIDLDGRRVRRGKLLSAADE